jgi:low affinity Fe/Cu permease
MKDLFRKTAHWTSDKVGSPLAFAFAVLAILAWGITGPLFGYSDTWQLIINTATTILTFLMVFLIQNTQNRDARAIHLKLDELIRAIDPARDDLIDVEDVTEDELAYLQEEFKAFRKSKIEEIKKAK